MSAEATWTDCKKTKMGVILAHIREIALSAGMQRVIELLDKADKENEYTNRTLDVVSNEAQKLYKEVEILKEATRG